MRKGKDAAAGLGRNAPVAPHMTQKRPTVIAAAAHTHFLGDSDLKRENFFCFPKKFAGQLVYGSRQGLRPVQMNQTGRNRPGCKSRRMALGPQFLEFFEGVIVAPHLVE